MARYLFLQLVVFVSASFFSLTEGASIETLNKAPLLIDEELRVYQSKFDEVIEIELDSLAWTGHTSLSHVEATYDHSTSELSYSPTEGADDRRYMLVTGTLKSNMLIFGLQDTRVYPSGSWALEPLFSGEGPFGLQLLNMHFSEIDAVLASAEGTEYTCEALNFDFDFEQGHFRGSMRYGETGPLLTKAEVNSAFEALVNENKETLKEVLRPLICKYIINTIPNSSNSVV